MSDTPHNTPNKPPTPTPSRRDILRPIELITGAATTAILVGLIVLTTNREPLLATIATGIVFITVLVVTAMFTLAFKPDADELADLDEQNRDPHASA